MPAVAVRVEISESVRDSKGEGVGYRKGELGLLGGSGGRSNSRALGVTFRSSSNSSVSTSRYSSLVEGILGRDFRNFVSSSELKHSSYSNEMRWEDKKDEKGLQVSRYGLKDPATIA